MSFGWDKLWNRMGLTVKTSGHSFGEEEQLLSGLPAYPDSHSSSASSTSCR